jgi:uncharacterized membrane protein
LELTLDIVAIAFIGPITGVEFAVSAFINPVLARVGGNLEAQAIRQFARILGALMPFWYVICFVLLIAETMLRQHEAGFFWVAAAAVLWATLILVTILVLVPINNRVAAMDPSEFNPSLRTLHRRWDRLHRGRIAILALAMILFLYGIRI